MSDSHLPYPCIGFKDLEDLLDGTTGGTSSEDAAATWSSDSIDEDEKQALRKELQALEKKLWQERLQQEVMEAIKASEGKPGADSLKELENKVVNIGIRSEYHLPYAIPEYKSRGKTTSKAAPAARSVLLKLYTYHWCLGMCLACSLVALITAISTCVGWGIYQSDPRVTVFVVLYPPQLVLMVLWGFAWKVHHTHWPS